MGAITTTDGTAIFYKDWGSGQPIVFSHGWPLSGDDWDTQMLFFLQLGYRVIAHDRRGHGRSAQTGGGHDMDRYADELAAVTAHLDLQDAVHVGHSTGGGEVVHYIARQGESRVAKAVLISAVPPLMVQTDANPGALPKSVFDALQAQLAANRSVLPGSGVGPESGSQGCKSCARGSAAQPTDQMVGRQGVGCCRPTGVRSGGAHRRREHYLERRRGPRGWPCGLRDQRGDSARVRDVDRVTAPLFGDSRLGSLCHCPLCRRRDHPVIARDQVPARSSPSWLD